MASQRDHKPLTKAFIKGYFRHELEGGGYGKHAMSRNGSFRTDWAWAPGQVLWWGLGKQIARLHSCPWLSSCPQERVVQQGKEKRTKECAEGHVQTHSPQHFWYQGLISWKTILPETESREIVWG